MDHKFETSKTFDGPSGNNYAELTLAREHEREDAIKRGLIDDPSKPKALEDAQVFRGTCQDMCPLYEREQREYQNDVKRWEMNQTTGRIDKDLAVKAFHRPAAGNEQALPSDVRPPPVLKRTLDYLIDKIVSGGDSLDKDTHGFVRDRTRSIRQDFTLQNERGAEAIACHERIVRFHILCLHQMCEIDGFDAHQEMEQLRKTLQSLAEYYDDQRDGGIEFPSEAEFRAYHILTRLRDPDVLRHVQSLPRHVRTDPAVRYALKLYKYAQRSNEEVGRFKPPNCEGSQNNYSTFFRLIRSAKTSYTTACLLETQFNDVRKGALKSMRRAFIAALKAPSVDELIDLLGCDDAVEVETQCEQYGIVVRLDEAGVSRPVLNKSTAFDETRPDLRQRFSESLVEAKRGNLSFADVINGIKGTDSPLVKIQSPAGKRRRFSSLKPATDDSIFSAPAPVASDSAVNAASTAAAPEPFTASNFAPASTKLGSAVSSTQFEFKTPEIPQITKIVPIQTISSEDKVDREKVVKAVTDAMVQKLIHEQTQIVARQVLAKEEQSKQLTDDFLADLSSQLVDDLIRNQLHETVTRAYATSWRDRHLKRRTLRHIQRVSDGVQFRRREQRERERAEAIRKQQYDDAFAELFAIPKRSNSRKRARTSLSQPSIANANSLHEASIISKKFWQPLDLCTLFNTVRIEDEQRTWRTVIALAESSCKYWIRAKFNLEDDQHTQEVSGKKFVVDLTDGTTTCHNLADAGVLIFSCSSEPESDRDFFLSLLQQIARESDYCFAVMILSFHKVQDEAALAESLMIRTVMADKKCPVSACHFVGIDTMSDVVAFESTLAQIYRDAKSIKSPLGIHRDAIKEQEERRRDIELKTPVRHFKRPRNAFYDYDMLKPFSPTTTPGTSKSSEPPPPEEVVPKQVIALRDEIKKANDLLAKYN